ncbi:MAG: CRTAC1 family protein [Polyangiaceae bacterium]
MVERAGVLGLGRAALLALLAATTACSSDGDSGGGSGGSGGGGVVNGCLDCPAPVCNAGTRWTAGNQVFVERTAEWGLTGVEGQRVNVADIDGDGFADLVVRRAAIAADDFTTGGTRNIFLMRNNGSKGFSDVTQSSGFLAMRTDSSGSKGRPGQVMAFADVDNDGDQDAFVALDTTDASKSLGESSELMLNDGSGQFSLGPDGSQARAAGEVSHPAGVTFVDYDRDGFLDLWVPQNTYGFNGIGAAPQQDRFYRGDGSGNFTLVTDQLGLATVPWGQIPDLNEAKAHSNAWSSAACDLNGDGYPELLAASYGRAPNHLWQGSATGFSNVSIASGYAFDGNQDWEDNQFARCYCQANPAADGCAGVPAPQISCTQPNWNHTQDREPFRLGGNSASTFCADIDNDGDMDLLTGEIRHWWAGAGADGSEVLVNQGGSDVHFDRPGDATLGLQVQQTSASWDEGHMTNAVFDFDNDGWPDIYIGASDYAGNHGLLYHQEAKLSFVEVPLAEGIDHHRSHGVAFADFDHDGDLDVVVGHSRARCDVSLPDNCYDTANVRLFENVLGEQGNYVQLRLEGIAGTNRSAVGARVTVKAGDVTQTQEVGGGFGHYGAQNDMVLHFGLGAACEAEVTVRWPNGELTTQMLTLPAGYRFYLKQGEPAVLDAPAAP